MFFQDSISSHPRVHCVWDEIFITLIGNPASDFELFWNTVVEGTVMYDFEVMEID